MLKKYEGLSQAIHRARPHLCGVCIHPVCRQCPLVSAGRYGSARSHRRVSPIGDMATCGNSCLLYLPDGGPTAYIPLTRNGDPIGSATVRVLLESGS